MADTFTQAAVGGIGRRYLPPASASARLADRWGIRRTVPTLATMRTRGGGPKFFKAGPSILYAEDDVDSWAEELLGAAVTSTSELRALGHKSSPHAAIQSEQTV